MTPEDEHELQREHDRTAAALEWMLVAIAVIGALAAFACTLAVVYAPTWPRAIAAVGLIIALAVVTLCYGVWLFRSRLPGGDE